jgi:hypothetical protein
MNCKRVAVDVLEYIQFKEGQNLLIISRPTGHTYISEDIPAASSTAKYRHPDPIKVFFPAEAISNNHLAVKSITNIQ